MATPTARMRSTMWFSSYATACVLLFWAPLRSLMQLALADYTYSYILIIPFVSLVLAWLEREQIFRTLGRSAWSAAVLLLVGVLLSTLGHKATSVWPGSDSLGLIILGFLCLIWAGFLFFYGSATFGAGLFALLFLLLMVPLPGLLLGRLILWMQVASADVAEWIFHLTGTPVLRQGFILALPRVTIEVAEGCSGIRSAQAMLITCLLAGHLFLRTNWRRTVLLAAAVPVLMIKSGIRIATLTLLAVHVDPSFLTGRLHEDGGFAFFAVGMLILLPVFWWLQKSEAVRVTRRELPVSAAAPVVPQG